MLAGTLNYDLVSHIVSLFWRVDSRDIIQRNQEEVEGLSRQTKSSLFRLSMPELYNLWGFIHIKL